MSTFPHLFVRPGGRLSCPLLRDQAGVTVAMVFAADGKTAANALAVGLAARANFLGAHGADLLEVLEDLEAAARAEGPEGTELRGRLGEMRRALVRALGAEVEVPESVGDRAVTR